MAIAVEEVAGRICIDLARREGSMALWIRVPGGGRVQLHAYPRSRFDTLWLFAEHGAVRRVPRQVVLSVSN